MEDGVKPGEEQNAHKRRSVRLKSADSPVSVLQTFLAQINQVFPAEDDVNKHVEDNCEFPPSVT